jgi:hypothetical protein
MAPNDARNMENDSRNPGLTPIDSTGNINRAGKKHEPDSTTGQFPSVPRRNRSGTTRNPVNPKTANARLPGR